MLVVSVAMLAIIGLVPIGMAANQKAVSKNYSADAADHVLSYMANRIRHDWTLVSNAAVLPDGQPASIASLNSPASVEGATNYASPEIGDYLYELTGINGGHRLIQRTTFNGEDNVDFDAVVRVWKTPTSGWEYDTGTSTWVERTDSSYNKRVQINLELSYPAMKPYAARTKALYTLEVSRQD